MAKYRTSKISGDGDVYDENYQNPSRILKLGPEWFEKILEESFHVFTIKPHSQPGLFYVIVSKYNKTCFSFVGNQSIWG